MEKHQLPISLMWLLLVLNLLLYVGQRHHSVTYQNSLSLGSSKKGYWLPSEQVSETTPRMGVTVFNNIILEVIFHYFSCILVELVEGYWIKYRIQVKHEFQMNILLVYSKYYIGVC